MDARYSITMWKPLRSELVYFTTSFNSMNDFMTDLCDGVLGTFGWDDLFTSKSEWVTSISFLPINVSIFGTLGQEYIVLGNKTLTTYTNFYTFGGATPSSYLRVFGFRVTGIHDNFLDYAPYTRRYLYIPYFEKIEIDSELCLGYEIYGYMSLDVFSGTLALYIEREDGLLLHHQSVKIGIEISLGKSNEEEIRRNNILHAVSLIGSGVTTGIGIATENPISASAGVGMITKTVTQALSTNVHRLSSYKGGNGNRTELICEKTPKYIVETVQNVTYPNRSLKGGVCRKNLSLSGVTGYTEIGEIHFNPSGAEITDDEISEIIDLLHSGVIL